MKLRLLDSGLDLLKAGVVYYKKFLSLHDTDELGLQDYLRLCIVSLHNSIELLCKKLLSDINDLLIYQDMSQSVLENLKSYLSKDEKKIPMHYYLLFGDKRVNLIDYQESIIRLKQLFEINDANFRALEELDRTKNRVFYFDFGQVSDYYEVIGNINRTLIFVQDFFYPKFSKNEEMDLQLDYLNDTINSGKAAEEEIWTTFITKKLKQLHRLFSHICLELNVEVKESQVRVDIDNADNFDEQNITLLVRKIDNGKILTKVKTQCLTGINALVFSGDFSDGPIYFIVDYSGGKEVLFIYDPPLQLPNYLFSQEKFWKKDETSIEIEYGFENLKKILFYICLITAKSLNTNEGWKK